jgi:molybdopterin synthase catalytic subunit
VLTRVQTDPISVDEALRFVAHPAVGGTCMFVGTVRDHSDAGAVRGLEYESWDDLAVRRLEEIAAEAAEEWPLSAIAIVHRTGSLTVGEASVVVAVGAAHRAEAFEACRQAIERLKHDVPIWKKEGLETGESHWVMGS